MWRVTGIAWFHYIPGDGGFHNRLQGFALGLLAGKGLAHADIFGRRAELVGGCVLIGIGLKILYEHGVLS